MTADDRMLLGINVDHVATLRQSRGTSYPDPVEAAMIAEQSGANSITVHLREDRRHIQEYDVHRLAERLQTRMNLEMAITDEMLEFACAVQPADCCLVPERRNELTTEGGLDVSSQKDHVKRALDRLTAAGIRVSAFIDPERSQLEACKLLGFEVVELHTGAYACAIDADTEENELKRLIRAVKFASDNNINVHAGHGLNYNNVARIAGIREISELNIGHAVVARSIFTGMGGAVLEMKRIINAARS